MTLKKRADGRIQLKRTIKYPDGSKTSKTFYGKTQREAELKYQEFLIELDREQKLSYIITFKKVSNMWLALKETSVQSYTYRGYKYKIEEMQDYFKEMQIASITNNDLQTYINLHSKESINTIKKRVVLLNSVFDFAMKNRYLTYNPMSDVTTPKCKAQKQRRAYEKAQAREIINLAKQSGINGLAAFIPLKTGLRPGEVVAFYPNRDVDFERMELTVNETVKLVDGKQVTGEPKSETSVRTIPVDSEFCEHIKGFNCNGYIFTNQRANNFDRPMNYSKWYTFRFKRFMETLPINIPRYDPHELRHTFGTLLYESGTDLYTIMKIMGHADVKVTQIYVHQRMDALRNKVKMDF